MVEQATGEYQPLAWQIIRDSLGYGEIYETAEDGGPGDLVASVYSDHEHLIAAAPDLLAALILVTQRCGPNSSDGAIARAAIALATGESAR